VEVGRSFTVSDWRRVRSEAVTCKITAIGTILLGEIAMSLPALFLRLSVSEPTGVKSAFENARNRSLEQRKKNKQMAQAVAAASEEARRKLHKAQEEEEERRKLHKAQEEEELQRLYRALEEGASSNPGAPEGGNRLSAEEIEHLLLEDDETMPPVQPERPAPAPAPPPAPAPKNPPVLKVHPALKKEPKPKTVSQTKPMPVDRKKVPVPTPKPPPEPPPERPPPAPVPAPEPEPELPPVQKPPEVHAWEAARERYDELQKNENAARRALEMLMAASLTKEDETINTPRLNQLYAKLQAVIRDKKAARGALYKARENLKSRPVEHSTRLNR
jgi:hypothetical protein